MVFNCERRKKVLANSNWCFYCLRKGHNDSQCMSEKNCRHCKKRHHQSMWSSSQKGKRINDQWICGQRNKQYDNECDIDYDQREYTTTQNCAFTNSTSCGTRWNRQNFDSSQDSVWYRKSKNLCHWKSTTEAEISSTRKAKSQHLWKLVANLKIATLFICASNDLAQLTMKQSIFQH